MVQKFTETVEMICAMNKILNRTLSCLLDSPGLYMDSGECYKHSGEDLGPIKSGISLACFVFVSEPYSQSVLAKSIAIKLKLNCNS
jgi:hypothetical protein